MLKQKDIPVAIPNHTLRSCLPAHAGKALQLVLDSGANGISLLSMKQAGCELPEKAIESIRKKGALIAGVPRPVTDSDGKLIAEVLHYVYTGWRTQGGGLLLYQHPRPVEDAV